MVTEIEVDEIIDRMNWRYAAKKFAPDAKVPEDVMDAILESLRLSPSSFGLQPWRFFVVQSPDVRRLLGDAAPLNRGKIESASHVIVLARLKHVSQEYIDRYVEDLRVTRGQSYEKVAKFHEMVSKKLASMSAEQHSVWTARQLYVALGTALTAAALLGVDTCPMEGIDPLAFDRILGLKGSDYTTTVGLALGYRADDDPYATLPKVRFSRSEVIEFV